MSECITLLHIRAAWRWSEGVVIEKYVLIQSHHWSHCRDTAEPVTVMCDNKSSASEELASPGIHVVVMIGAAWCQHTATQICSQSQMVWFLLVSLISTVMMTETNKSRLVKHDDIDLILFSQYIHSSTFKLQMDASYPKMWHSRVFFVIH